jgi:hypothetical protein
MDENFRELEREAFESSFKGEADGDTGDAGYGIDPRQADSDAMASAFDSPDVEAEPLPELPDESQSSQAPVEMKAKAAEPAERPAATPEFKTFGQAFKWHREQALKNGGPNVFDWKGEKKHIMIKSEWEAMKAAKKAKAEASQKAQEAKQFEADFVNRDKPAVKATALATGPAAGKASPAVDRSKTLAYREGAASQPVNLNDDPTRIKTVDEIATGVARTVKSVPGEPAPKDIRPWYQAGPKNTFIREGDDPKNGPIYGNKPAGSKVENPRADELYRGKGVKQGEMS